MAKQNSPKTPKQILDEREKKTFSFSLNKKNVEIIAAMAIHSGLPVSTLVDEAISYYLNKIDETK